MVIKISVQYNGGFVHPMLVPSGTRLNAMNRFFICSL